MRATRSPGWQEPRARMVRVSEITKMLFAAGLLAAGFFGASMFGVPDAGDAPTGRDDWTPQPLEPLDNRDLLPATASTTWDENFELTAHTDDGFNTDQLGRTSTAHQAAHSGWSQQKPESMANGDLAAPEIRRAPMNRSGQPATNAWPTFGASPRQETPALTPPPLLQASPRARSAMRTTRFPERPADAVDTIPVQDVNRAPSFPSFPSPPTGVSPPPLMTLPQSASAASTTMSEPIWHVVTDGDSLPKIAQRYLRDANRAREVYDMNRDKLDSPDLLPIGAELRIPQTVAATRTFNVFDSSGGQADGFEPQSHLVPLPELPESVRSMPRARLQAPVNASFAGN